MALADNSEKLTLLLVDDDAELCNMMKEFFGENGYRLETVHNGRDGLTHAVDDHYDLVILDVMLPRSTDLRFCISFAGAAMCR